ncbi:MAG: thioredoxin-disulfide reductase [Dehalococcoidia bacterium]|nr:MAG: thioredoxin-disulfide reductase [Dehalococcoidia bacterium]
MNNKYDVVIIGGGPAGLTAGIYTSRDNLKSLIIEKGIIGGNMNNAEIIDNYPGFPEGVNGPELANLMHRQAKRYGLETIAAEVIAIKDLGNKKLLQTSDGDIIARAVIIAGGSEKLKLSIPGEKEFTGRGVSYCTTCDAFFFRNKNVVVVGGGNSAIYEAMHLTKFASKIYIIHRRNQLRATAILQERARAETKIKFILDTIVKEIQGKDFVQKLVLENVKTGKKSTLEVDGVFISIGLKPNTDFVKDLLSLDKQGHIITDENMNTETAGILAAGDIRSGAIRQITTAAGDGTIAAIEAKRFIDDQ